MAKLNEVHNIVFNILITHPESRSDDYLLVFEVFKHYKVDDFSIHFAFKKHIELGLPSLETITRCRRKIQHDHPELSGSKMRVIRKKEESKFKQYAFEYNQ